MAMSVPWECCRRSTEERMGPGNLTYGARGPFISRCFLIVMLVIAMSFRSTGTGKFPDLRNAEINMAILLRYLQYLHLFVLCYLKVSSLRICTNWICGICSASTSLELLHSGAHLATYTYFENVIAYTTAIGCRYTHPWNRTFEHRSPRIENICLSHCRYN